MFGQGFSWRDLILIAGGLFLVWKATKEIHHSVDPEPGPDMFEGGRVGITFGAAIVQILLLDLVFSIDSIITAVGMTDHIPIMIIAVIAAVLAMMLAADPLANFIQRNPTIVMLALGFLLLIGTTLIAEGFGAHVPKGYIYAAMAFSALVEVLNMLSRRARERKSGSGPAGHSRRWRPVLAAGQPVALEAAAVGLRRHDAQHDLAESLHRIGPRIAVGARDSRALIGGQHLLQRAPAFGQAEQALAPVPTPLALVDESFAHELAEHAAQALLGDAQDFEQFRYRDAGIAPHEIDHAVMRPTEALFRQDGVRPRGEVAVGEEQHLDALPQFLVAQEERVGGRLGRRFRGCGYVSHVDIYDSRCYKAQPSGDRMYRF